MIAEEKMELWSKKCKELSKKFRAYEERYRKKIYPKLTEEEKRKRNYRIINEKEYCDRIKQARQSYFKKEIEELLNELDEKKSKYYTSTNTESRELKKEIEDTSKEVKKLLDAELYKSLLQKNYKKMNFASNAIESSSPQSYFFKEGLN